MAHEIGCTECDVCGKEIVLIAVYSGDGNEELCHECYHDIYDSDDEDDLN